MHWNSPAGRGADPGPLSCPRCSRPARRVSAHASRFLGAVGTFAALSVHAALPAYESFASLSFEELANIQITSVSKKAERLADAAASVYVITNEDIRRAGATNLPAALRLAPNLQVAQISAQNYAISARGFNNTTANKLLVLIDGRTVYTPLYSGVFWDAQDVMLEDVERIEVISGPGGTLWGTNAVNGVINVITRSAQESQGGLLVAGGGNREQGAAVRYGAPLGNGGHYRIYGKYSDRNHTSTASDKAVRDDWNKAQAGFRADWGSAQEQFTLQGDAYRGDLDQISLPSAARISGLNLLSRWNRKLANGSSFNLSAYYDRTERNFPGSYHETLDIVDMQVQHAWQPIGAHSIVWGARYRQAIDQMDNSNTLAFLPAYLKQTWGGVFVQDEVELRSDLRLTAGVRVGRNDYTGVEVLPSVRLAWKASAEQLLWSAISRAVRTPSRIDRDFYAPSQPPYLLTGNTTFRAEVANVIELGYRAQPTKTMSYSVTAFHAVYDDLRSLERLASGSFVIGNQMEGSTSGIEAWGAYQATPTWRLSAGFTAMKERLRLKPGSTDPIGISGAGNDPAHSWQLRSAWDIAAGRELDIALRHVAALPNPAVPAYTAVDVRFGWKLQRDLELSLTGQNLFSGNHAEFGSLPNRSEIAPGIFLKLLWKI